MPVGFNFGAMLAWTSFVCFCVTGAAHRSVILFVVASVLGGGALAFAVRSHMRLGASALYVLLALVLAIPLVLIKALYYPVSIMFFVAVPASIAVALFIFEFPAFFRIKALLICLLSVYFVLVLAGHDPGEVFVGSRNQISTLFVALSAVALVINRSRYDIFLALSVFIACVVAVGSSGIISSGVILAAVLFRDYKWRAAFCLAGTLAFVLMGNLFFMDYLPDDLVLKFNMERLLGGDVRYQIIEGYIADYSSGYFLLMGAPEGVLFSVYDALSYGGGYGDVGTLHNSYLSAHMKMGIASFVVFLSIIRVAWLLRRNLFFLALFFSILVRAFSDTVFIVDGYYNFAFFFYYILAERLSGRGTGGGVLSAGNRP